MAESPTIRLLQQTHCPHCWATFDPADVLAIASHEDLRGDPRAGQDEMLRFLPSRFSIDGTPVDARGMVCPDIACPHCHLKLPQAALSDEPIVVSVIGSPSSGKSYYLTALAWEARRELPAAFGISFTDADPAANLALTENERNLFLSDHPDRLTPLGGLIRKTQLDGKDLYTSVSFDGQPVRHPRPLLFSLRPAPTPGHVPAAWSHRLLALYDNAGEHFQPGNDSPSAPVTRHLVRAAFQLFLFDPTMDPRFRASAGLTRWPTVTNDRQEQTLAETASRYRRLKGLPAGARTDTPLLVVVTKADLWGEAVKVDCAHPGTRRIGDLTALDQRAIETRSDALRQVLMRGCPELVTAAEGYSSRVTYFPVSVTGTQPEWVTVDGVARGAVRPKDLRPQGVLAPLLFGLRREVPKMIRTAVKKSAKPDGVKADDSSPALPGIPLPWSKN